MGKLGNRAGTVVFTFLTLVGSTAHGVFECNDGWDKLNGAEQVANARHQDRPSFFDYTERAFTGFKEIEVLGADGSPLQSRALIVGRAQVQVPGGEAIDVMVIGQNRGRDTKDRLAADFGLTRPEGYEKARVAMELANQQGIPVITLVDTKGAHPSVQSEQENQSRAIAELLLTQRGLNVPHVAVVIGEGGSGGALALAQADRVLIPQGAYYTVSTIETAANFLKQPKEKLPEVADALHLTPPKLLGLGVVDEVLPETEHFRWETPKTEPTEAQKQRQSIARALQEFGVEGNADLGAIVDGTAHAPPAQFKTEYGEGDKLFLLASVKRGIRKHLLELREMTPEQRREAYYQRYRRLGQFEEGERSEVQGLQLTEFDQGTYFPKNHEALKPEEPVAPNHPGEFEKREFVEQPFVARRAPSQEEAERVVAGIGLEGKPDVERWKAWEAHRKEEHVRKEAERRKQWERTEVQRRKLHAVAVREYEQAQADYERGQAAYPKQYSDWLDGHVRTPRQTLGELVDSAEGFVELNPDMVPSDPLNFQVKPYQRSVAEAQAKTGEKEAVVTGIGQVDGQRVAIAVMNPYFRMATLNSVVGEKITRLTERAKEEGIPLVIVSASGGARMEEGPLSLMQMSKVSSAIKDYRDAGGRYISVLSDPTYGGVSASYANQAPVEDIIGIRNARVGFTGPAAIRALEPSVQFPDGFQTSEYHLEQGNIGEVVSPGDLKQAISRRIGN